MSIKHSKGYCIIRTTFITGLIQKSWQESVRYWPISVMNASSALEILNLNISVSRRAVGNNKVLRIMLPKLYKKEGAIFPNKLFSSMRAKDAIAAQLPCQAIPMKLELMNTVTVD